MLVIRRRAGESVLIGDEVEVRVTEIGSTRVKLCILAPKDVVVLRKEVKLTREANVAAAREAPADLTGLAARFRAKQER
ncbi:MAG TPA: carbon storage regulator [Bryobacteraceae bacterium]|nr:carbon storage regulator [Bryobacteraceae bacterium]HOQ45209.1 carbon storage regulator [Bryobacteraceae bacterium]HPQ14318.1 carbon storage regulator [Bryobacteraceae bacterium]HPU71281.1 carbon storage regulator [Bryobacteraceae bacterium]